MNDNSSKLPGNDGFKGFYLKTYDAVFGFVQSYLTTPEQSEDVVQECFFRLYKNWDKFGTESDARAWLYVTSRNMSLDNLRHRKFSGGELTDIHESDDFFLDEITRQEALYALRTSIDTLPMQTRKVAILAYEGKSNAEIAEVMGLSVNSVKSLKKDAYRKLRMVLEKQYHFMLFILLF